jgi:hypothetical protein
VKKKQDKATSPQFAIKAAEGFYDTGISLAKHLNSDISEDGYIWIPLRVVNRLER